MIAEFKVATPVVTNGINMLPLSLPSLLDKSEGCYQHY